MERQRRWFMECAVWSWLLWREWRAIIQSPWSQLIEHSEFVERPSTIRQTKVYVHMHICRPIVGQEYKAQEETYKITRRSERGSIVGHQVARSLFPFSCGLAPARWRRTHPKLISSGAWNMVYNHRCVEHASILSFPSFCFSSFHWFCLHPPGHYQHGIMCWWCPT